MITEFKEIKDYLSQINLETECQLDDLIIYNFNEVKEYSDFSGQPYRQNFYEVSLEVNQGCSFQIDHYKFLPQSSRLTIVAPGRLQTNLAYDHTTEESRGFSILFSESFIDTHLNINKFYKDYGFLKTFNSPVIDLNTNDLTQFQKLFELIKYEYQEYGRQSTNTLKSMIRVIFDKAVQANSQTDANHQALSRAKQIFIEFEKLCITYYKSKSTVKEYASLLHLTPKHLSECVKQATGRTALQILLDFKLNNAKALLRQTTFNISEIAYQSGFESPHYFSSCFKRHIGIKPSEFRKI